MANRGNRRNTRNPGRSAEDYSRASYGSTPARGSRGQRQAQPSRQAQPLCQARQQPTWQARQSRQQPTRQTRQRGTSRPDVDSASARRQRQVQQPQGKQQQRKQQLQRQIPQVQQPERQQSQQSQRPARQQSQRQFAATPGGRSARQQQPQRQQRPQQSARQQRQQQPRQQQLRQQQPRQQQPRQQQPRQQQEPELVSTTVGSLRRADRREKAKTASRRYLVRVLVIVAVAVALVGGWAALYNSPAFTIHNVEVNGVEHLTSQEMATLANVPADTTLLRVDAGTIESRVEQNAWVADASVDRKFPDTLVINVKERPIKAIVEIPTSGGTTVKKWAISEDHVWLMPIPELNSEAAKTTSSKVYEDAEKALHITNIPIGTKAEIGAVCTDGNVNNALDIVSGLTTELADHVKTVSAAGTAETTLILDSGVEIAFGKAEDIRDKERVVLQIMDEHPGVAYINVRMVETPTWREV